MSQQHTSPRTTTHRPSPTQANTHTQHPYPIEIERETDLMRFVSPMTSTTTDDRRDFREQADGAPYEDAA
jgi:hypothetical protein